MRRSTVSASKLPALFCLSALGLAATGACARVTIGSVPTRNMSCVANVCTPTDEGAYLNAGDLQAMLASGSVTVKSLEISKSIVVNAPLTWTSGVTLTLDSYQSLTIRKALSVTGAGGLTLLTNDGGTNGVLSIGGYGHVTFASLSSPLTINGEAYTLVNSLASLANHVGASPNGLYALANDYDAKAYGVYASSPVTTPFSGTFDGLGNKITDLQIMALKERNVGLFSTVNGGAVQHIKLIRIKILDKDQIDSHVGGMVGSASHANLFEVSVSGVVKDSRLSAVGGLIGFAEVATVENCHANVDVSGGNKSFVGGLVGYGYVAISNSYAMGSVSVAPLTGPPSRNRGYAGGLMGEADGSVVAAYSTASVGDPAGNVVGGAFGLDEGAISANNYWDTTTSGVTNPGQGAGLPANAPGITGLTTAQLQAGLPAGFDPTVWGEDPAINGGLPYLLDDPPL